MGSNRRDFLRNTLISAGLLSSGLMACTPSAQENKKNTAKSPDRTQRFNMSGFAAPKLNVVRVGFIGLGQRGPGAVKRMTHIEGVEITALCDVHEDRVEKCQQMLETQGLPRAKSYSGTKEAWKAICESPDVDLVYITTPWEYHTPMAVYAMGNGKHTAVEVPAAKTLDECWQLVETSERTQKHCMMLENCCYDFFELLTLNMARQGYFGEIIHGEGAYIHNLLESNFNKNGYTEMWRLKENFRNGNLYPTHGLGPICQIMDINRGDQMEYLTAMQSADFQMAAMAKKLASEDNFFTEFAAKQYRGNMNTTTVKTYKGRTIMIQHDVTSPRPYSRIHLVSGTKGMASKWPAPERVSKGHDWMNDEEMKKLYDEFTPEIVKKVGEMAKQVGGHGGMDFMMDWRLTDCLRNGLPLDQDVYDAALWSAIAPLSEMSVANRSNSVDVPDFTCGAWKTNAPVELTLKGGGTTGVRKINKADASKQLNV
ncbi:MAG: Gfo/Idh/MocA family oxidoreductase [Prolixibacteraceae bacterium]|jgi:predicted dehydrogenase|nr:Gfo/Idh/MocA family oxidoreductase [Prolixibacteraceae bacterium]